MIKNSIEGLLYFIFGFIIGTALDALFYLIYRRMDKHHTNMSLLVAMILLQMFFLISFVIIIGIVDKKEINALFLRIGLLSPQIFSLNIARKKLRAYFLDK